MCHRCGSALRQISKYPMTLSPKRARRVRRLYLRLQELIAKLRRALAVR